jgi:hypothetical protein
VQATVGHAEIVLGCAQVELTHHWDQSGRTRERTEQLRELLRDAGVGFAWSWDHVQYTLPHLIEAIEAGAPAPGEQLSKPCGGRIKDQRAHTQSVPLDGSGRTKSVNFCQKRPSTAIMTKMTTVIVPGRQVRLPANAREAVASHRTVEVRNHDKPVYYVIHADDYAVVEHLLQRHRRGLPVPVTDLLTDEDFAVLAEERDLDAGFDAGILAAWER